MALLTRRHLVRGLGAGALGLVGLRLALPRWLRAGPVRALEDLSPGARDLVARAADGLRLERVVDLHVHLAGLGGAGPDGAPSGCWVNPRLRSHLHPLERLRFELYLGAAGVPEDETADARYVERLERLLEAGLPGPRLLLLAFDVRVGEDGREDLEGSMFRVPDEYVCALARGRPRFLACASVHPYRADSLERLRRARELGAVAVKWLPNAMGIDPAAARCEPFYRELAALGMPLLVHTGEERAVWVPGAQELGNPLRLRRALAAGCTVVALHCGSLGHARDLDLESGPARPAFELFLRLAREAGPGGRLFGELSALTQVNREGADLEALLEGEVSAERLVNGSDYPLAAVDPLTSLGRLERGGFLETEDLPPLREVFAANPLLFDLVLKRCLRAPGSADLRFPPAVFESARLFDKL